MQKIKVIDSIMGSGKTTWAIEEMNRNPDKSYIYITPFLSEIKRIKDSCPNVKFYEPSQEGRKFKEFNSLLTSGKSIVSTHATFRRSNDETYELLQNNNYILILDEVLDILEPVDLKKDDLPSMLELKLCHLDQNGYIVWDKPGYDGKYNQIKELSMGRGLFVVDNTVLLWLFPKEIFNSMAQVIILTYMFDCQVQKYYFDFYNIQYDKFRVESGQIVPHDGRTEDRSTIKIKIVENHQINNVGDDEYALSKSWYDKSKRSLPILQKNLYNFFRNIAVRGSKFNLWTTFKEYKSDLAGNGYAQGFLSHNARAVNDYRHKTAVAYCINKYPNPFVTKFFSYNNIQMDQNKYALSEMMQFLFRSAIRDGKEIILYVPSYRMRNLLKNWLAGQIC